MESWRAELYANELYHHGIKNQRWGVRNGPPYPLTAEAKRQAYRKQGRRLVAGGVIAGAAGAGLKAAVKQCLKDSNNSNDFDESDVWRLTYFATH